MFGQDIVGRKCYEVYHRRTEPCEPHPCLTLRAFEDGKVHEHGVQVIDKDGHARYFHCTANVALRDAEGKPATVLELSRDITAIKQAEIQLLAYQQQLRALTAQVSSAEERERRRLATELHDHIGQALAVAKIKLGRARREAGNSPVSGLLGEVHGLIDRMIQDTRSLAFQLSPPLLHELGFVEAVEWLVEQFRTEHGLSIEVKGEGGSLPLDGDLAGMLFRGVRELLMNVVKHARAKKTQVIIGRDGPHMRVEVRDDGDGFDTSGHPTIGGGSGFGLFSLRERLSYLGGRLEVESARGRGTRVVMVVPAGEGKPAEGAR
jgi:signal transduction histidine kinase